jgi:hypothetical protein
MNTENVSEEVQRELIALRAEVKQLKDELEVLHLEKKYSDALQARMALRADRYFLQLQAIREAALGDVCGLVAEVKGEDFSGLEERE